jgi:hypothetical protein
LLVTAQKSADTKGLCIVLRTLRHSSARNWSTACVWAASNYLVTSADDLQTMSHHNVNFMVGSVHCVVV